jgi:uncharacterized membrane protein
VTLVVTDFSISISPSSQIVSRGSNAAYGVTVTPLGPFVGTVTLNLTGLPASTSSSFNPTSITGSGTSTLTISPQLNAPTGTYRLTVTGTSGGGAKHSAKVTLVIQ